MKSHLCALPVLVSVLLPSQAFAGQQLEAAIKRIAALESRMQRMDALEAENRRLRARFGKHAVAIPSAPAAVKEAVLATPQPQPEALTRWGGFYAGVNAGYGEALINSTNTTVLALVPSPGVLSQPTGAILRDSRLDKVNGPLVGGQIGYNRFADRYIIGIEADFAYADVASKNYFNYAASANGGAIYGAASGARVGLDWLGTVRAKVGYDLGRFLPYLTGGFAYGQLSVDNQSDYSGYSVCCHAEGNFSTVSAGWAAGAGAEYRVSDNWSVKGEYLYMDLEAVMYFYEAAV